MCAHLQLFLRIDWQGPSFIGARRVDGIWEWQGRISEPMTYNEWWDFNEPSGDGDCTDFNGFQRFNDLNCNQHLTFFCETKRNA